MAEENGVDVSNQIKELEERAKQVGAGGLHSRHKARLGGGGGGGTAGLAAVHAFRQ